MFIDDIRQDFYNVLLGHRVLLLVHYDVDAICTCKILQDLFKCDNVSYTLVPVGGISELKTAYEENCEEIKYVVLINCGGTIDLVDILQPEEDVVFFVLDSHKPTDVCNVYSDGQVRLVHRDNEENIPDFDDIFRDDEEENEEEEPEGGREALEAAVERRRARRAWEERRHTLMFNYTQFSYYGKPSACVLLELCHVASRCGVAALWAASVAAVAARAQAQRAPAACLLDADTLHRLVAGLRRTGGDDTQARLALEKEAWLPLYRVWSLEAALKHSPLVGPHLKMHTLAGANKLRQLLADMGFPLQQARQAYRSMDVELRRSLITALETSAPKHKLPTPVEATFLLYRPHSPPLPALDVTYAILGLIEHQTLPPAEGFQHALSALDILPGCCESRRLGFASAQAALQGVARLVHSTLTSRGLHLAGPFSYFIVQEGTPEAELVKGPHWLGVATRWLSAAGGGTRPLLGAAPAAGPERGRSLLLGLPPRADHEPRNLFGAAFEQAAAKSGVSVSIDYIDSSVITLPTSQRTQFLDALTALLA
ncbi:cell division control protein 45 homolog [Pectinophora gossypiella]|uniref:cell division control protein 45 homolog n=1 Tax=Pectinophora gossypiella TaxID=13191 RepID=UPI00214E534C|nr:cell division control protein 45 homolog [Pectinophora gossypiella]